MTTTPTIPFQVRAIPAAALEAVRTGGVDASGQPAEHVVAQGGEPLRCCLSNAEAGAELLLFSYRLPLPPSPYREVGPVFTHAHPCSGYPGDDTYPPDFRGHPQVLRAYDARGRIHSATRVDDGSNPEGSLTQMLRDPGVAQVHSRNVAHGCFMFSVTRGGSAG